MPGMCFFTKSLCKTSGFVTGCYIEFIRLPVCGGWPDIKQIQVDFNSFIQQNTIKRSC